MSIFETFRIAFRAISANKLRSGLTMLGIIIGVAAVVALMAAGQGATSGITSRVEGMGTNLITISTGRSFQFMYGGQSQQLLYSDFEALMEDLGASGEIAPYYQGSASVMNGDRSANASVRGVTPEYIDVNAYELAKGRFISAEDNFQKQRVVVLGSSSAEDLFAGLNPLKREIKINGKSFEVVGVLAEKGSNDDLVLIPLQTGYSLVFGAEARSKGQYTLSSISLSAYDAEQVDTLIARIEFILRREHGNKLTDELPFNVSSQSQMLESLSSISSTLTTLLGAIAGISLLVGGIGIMNITLVSVRERTREIGLRKAVGATRGVILFQFLVETLALSLMGGLLGVLLGWAIAWGVSASGLLTATVTPNVVFLSVAMATLVGLVFGLYPAFQAAGLRPVEALRYE